MAKISQTLSMPTGGGIPNTSPAQKLSISPEVQAIASVASAGLDLWGKAQVKQEQKRQQSQLGKAQVSLLDLQDEAMNQQEQARQVRGQISSFYENDGELSGDELRMMAGLKEQLSKFDLLSPSQRQIRKNALFRQALNDPANAGMQSSIISLFGGQKAEPVEDFSQQEAAQVAMDGKYGQGSWTQEDLARERGRAMYLSRMQQQASVNIDATIQQLDVITSAAQDDVTTAIGQAYQQHGFVPPEQANELRLKIADSQTQMRQTMLESLQASGKHLTPELRDKVEAELAENVEVLNKFMSGDGNMLDKFSLAKQLEARNNLTTQLIEYNAPNVLKAANSSFVGGANNSYGGFDAMMKLFTDPSNTSLLDALGITEDERTVGIAAGTATLKYILSADARAKEQMGRYGFTRLDAALAGNIGLPTAENPGQVERSLEAALAGDAKDFADILTDVKNMAAINANNGQQAVIASTRKKFIDIVEKAQLRDRQRNGFMVKDGKIVMSEEMIKLVTLDSLLITPEQLMEQVNHINRVIEKYPDVLNARDVISSVGEVYVPELTTVGSDKPPAEKASSGQETLDENARIEAEAAKLAPVDPAPFDPTTGSDLLGPTDGETPVPQAESTVASRAAARAEAGVQAFNEQNPQNPTQETPTVPKAAVTKQSAPVSSDDGKKFGKADKEVDTIVNTLREGITDPTSGKTIGLEGFSTSTYVPAGDKSGVTIGTGIDLRHQSEQGLIKQGVPKAIAAKLRPYYGKKDKALEGQEPLSRSEIEVLDKAVVSYKLKQLKSAIPEFESFPDALKLGLYKAKHQYGAFDSFNLKSQAARNDVRAAIGNLMSWSDSTKDVGGNIARKYQVMGELAANATPSMIMQLLRTASEEYKKDISSLGSDLLR